MSITRRATLTVLTLLSLAPLARADSPADPRDAVAFNNRGVVREEKGDLDRALADYGEAIRLDPRYALAYRNRANVLARTRELDAAMADYAQAIRFSPSDATTFLKRGEAWQMLGRGEYARQDYRRALDLAPSDDVRQRAERTLEQCILHGTTRMRTQVEVDPGIGMRGFEGVQSLIADYKWAIDIEICVFPQEGLISYPGTDELLVQGLKRGATVIGGAPRYDKDEAGQIRRIFELARLAVVSLQCWRETHSVPSFRNRKELNDRLCGKTNAQVEALLGKPAED